MSREKILYSVKLMETKLEEINKLLSQYPNIDRQTTFVEWLGPHSAIQKKDAAYNKAWDLVDEIWGIIISIEERFQLYGLSIRNPKLGEILNIKNKKNVSLRETIGIFRTLTGYIRAKALEIPA